MKIKFPELRDICLMDTQELLVSLADRFGVAVQYGKWGGEFVYVDNGAKTLAVAHLDTVADYRSSWKKAMDGKTWIAAPTGENISYKEMFISSRKQHRKRGIPTRLSASTCAQSIALDDRLGVWMIANVLPEMGIQSDFLFTTGEEVGRTTAFDFALVCTKQYNWIYEFDRRDFNPVLYDYDEPQLRQLLSTFGYRVVNGSFSDISELESLGCKAINFGVGYDYEHTNRCVASIDSVILEAKKFVQFWAATKDTFLPHVQYMSAWDKLDTGDSKDLNWGYFKDEADWDSAQDTKTSFDLGEISCDFCGGTASRTVHLDADYFLCNWCFLELYPKDRQGENGWVDENGRYWDDWDDNGKTRFLGQGKKKR